MEEFMIQNIMGKKNYGCAHDLKVVLADEGSESREFVESFAAKVYRRFYGMELKTFCREILAIKSGSTGLLSCIGINTPESGELFLEQYLDAPVEVEISSITGASVNREEIVEVGTLAVRSRGFCRLMMAVLAGYLLQRRKRYFIFTAVKALRNTFEHLGISFIPITKALPERFQNSHEWGSYYDASPEVGFVDLAESLRQIKKILKNTDQGHSEELGTLLNTMFLEGMLLGDRPKIAAGF
jgi:hypothetical protein